ncbi:glycosyltransferase family 9 protein [Sphingomonas crusticola]|uniref:glycosyltransferase family 9 protein n=1 Tax=Sphingomonas crusticola TaxID=1697973 RepID=UPI0013C2B5B9|nr:glycosyltransferase family 9 protein [Sphingomonas crusticola]
MIRRADVERDRGDARRAAFLYAEALRLLPDNSGVHIQCGHMLKESGQHAEAEVHYRRAAELRPGDADLALQMGHFFKSAGRLSQAQEQYSRALALSRGWAEPVRELASLTAAGLPKSDSKEAARPRHLAGEGGDPISGASALVAELAPRGISGLQRPPIDFIELRRLGRDERTHWGRMRTLRGLEAIRGYYIAATPIVEIKFLVNGELIYRGQPRGGYPLAPEFGDDAHLKYVFNVWMDFSKILPGKYEFTVEVQDAKRRTATRREHVVVAAPLAEGDFPASDGLIALADGDARSPEEQVNSRPSMVRHGRRRLLPSQPKAVLIQRTDQLGDLVVALPAIRRLREIFPEARLVGLVSPANVGLAAKFDLFDDLLTVDFAEDAAERRRTMPLSEQAALRERLAPFSFDVAIDLSENVWSRPLLLLSDAPFLVGFRSGNVPLDVEIEGFTHDRFDNHEVVPHTNKLLGLVEWLASMLRSETNLLPLSDPDHNLLSDFGLSPRDRFVVLHDGARLKFSRWPYYRDLAQRLLEKTDLRVVWVTDEADTRETLSADLLGSPRFTLVDKRPSFDAFDTLLASCAVLVGNDSGPKHLASLRGAKVVSVHMARNNWNEWGQENDGYIISRKVPCAGCLIHHDPEECGKDFVCIRGITPEEVMGAVLKLL